MNIAPVAPLAASPSNPPLTQTHLGTVRWFNPDRGFGFIVDDTAPADLVFVHYSSIATQGVRELLAGQRVSFDWTDGGRGAKGPQAENVQLVD